MVVNSLIKNLPVFGFSDFCCIIIMGIGLRYWNKNIDVNYGYI